MARWLVARQCGQGVHAGRQGDAVFRDVIRPHVKLENAAAHVTDGFRRFHQQGIGGELIKAGEGLTADAHVISIGSRV